MRLHKCKNSELGACWSFLIAAMGPIGWSGISEGKSSNKKRSKKEILKIWLYSVIARMLAFTQNRMENYMTSSDIFQQNHSGCFAENKLER